MNKILHIAFFLLLSTGAFAQKPAPVYTLCGKSGNEVTMTWDEFMSCKKELVADKGLSIGSFIVTIEKAEKKETTYVEFPVKGSIFSKSAKETIEKLHNDKKMGNTVTIEAVEILQSGQAARKVPGMKIILN